MLFAIVRCIAFIQQFSVSARFGNQLSGKANAFVKKTAEMRGTYTHARDGHRP